MHLNKSTSMQSSTSSWKSSPMIYSTMIKQPKSVTFFHLYLSSSFFFLISSEWYVVKLKTKCAYYKSECAQLKSQCLKLRSDLLDERIAYTLLFLSRKPVLGHRIASTQTDPVSLSLSLSLSISLWYKILSHIDTDIVVRMSLMQIVRLIVVSGPITRYDSNNNNQQTLHIMYTDQMCRMKFNQTNKTLYVSHPCVTLQCRQIRYVFPTHVYIYTLGSSC